MSKIIALWGSPNSGKKTLSLKLALNIYQNYLSTVIIVFPSNETPVLPELFPHIKEDEFFSIGVPLSKTEIMLEGVLESIVTVKTKMNMGFLGYKLGENKYTYPNYDDIKAKSILAVLKNLADFVIVDCSSAMDNQLSLTAFEHADIVLRIANPDLKSISFFSSQLPLYADPKYKTEKHITILNSSNKMMASEETKSYFKDVEVSLPYCEAIKKQSNEGELLNKINDKKFNKALNLIVRKVV